jgi:hypothetical protein
VNWSIDALDECPQTADRQEREKLLRCIRSLLGKQSNILHVFATSRPEFDILSELEPYPMINIETVVNSDIRRFVENALSSRELSGWGDNINQDIKDNLLSTGET